MRRDARTIGATVVALIAVLLLIGFAAGSQRPALWHEPNERIGRPAPDGLMPKTSVEESPLGSLPQMGDTESDDLGHLGKVLTGLLIAAAAVVAILLIRWLRRQVRSRRASPVSALSPIEPLDLPDAVDAASQDLFEALTDGEPRNAIVACWVRLESVLTASGLAPSKAETSSEFTARILTSYSVDGVAIAGLASLYREARFSRHAMTEAHRDAAVAALRDLHTQLRARRQGAAATEVGEP